MKFSPHFLVGASVSVVVLATVIGSFFITGSPTTERIRRLDQQRVNDLQSLNNAINSFTEQNQKTLPSSLEELSKQPNFYVSSIVDPMTRFPYVYRILTPESYELCAKFESDTSQRSSSQAKVLSLPENRFWQHAIGETCFSFKVPVPQPLPLK